MKGIIFTAAAFAIFAASSLGQTSQSASTAAPATRPTEAPPTAQEYQRIRMENRRLREKIADLQQEVATLRVILAHAKADGSSPATQPAAAAQVAKALVGRWRGGDMAAGSNYLLQFDEDGTYRQTFVSYSQRTAGHFRLLDDATLEMWAQPQREDGPHNHYKVEVSAARMTLTPLIDNGTEIKPGRPMVMERVE